MKNSNVLSIVLGSFMTMGSVLVIENLFDMFCFYNSLDALPISLQILMLCLNLAVCFMAGTFPLVTGNKQLKNSFIIGLFATLFAAYDFFYLMPFSSWYHLTSMLLLLPSCYLGGYVFKKVVQFPESLMIT